MKQWFLKITDFANVTAALLLLFFALIKLLMYIVYSVL